MKHNLKEYQVLEKEIGSLNFKISKYNKSLRYVMDEYIEMLGQEGCLIQCKQHQPGKQTVSIIFPKKEAIGYDLAECKVLKYDMIILNINTNSYEAVSICLKRDQRDRGFKSWRTDQPPFNGFKPVRGNDLKVMMQLLHQDFYVYHPIHCNYYINFMGLYDESNQNVLQAYKYRADLNADVPLGTEIPISYLKLDKEQVGYRLDKGFRERSILRESRPCFQKYVRVIKNYFNQ